MTVNRYCTPEWLAHSAEAYRSDPRFQQELAKLTTKMCFRVKAEPAWGLEQDIIFGGFVDQGELKELAFFSEEEARQKADYIVAATPQKWKAIMRKDAKFITEFMLGRVVLEQGSKVGHTAAEKAEIRDLKRELATVRMERDILKKALGFFANENQ